LIYGGDAMRVALKRRHKLSEKPIGHPNALKRKMRLTRSQPADLRPRDASDASCAIKAVGFFPGPARFVEDAMTNTPKSCLIAPGATWQPGDAQLW